MTFPYPARSDFGVLTTVKTAVSVGASSIALNYASSPYRNPQNAPSLERRALVLIDDFESPTKIEIIHYTGNVTDTGTGITLNNVIKNAENGFGDQSWSVGAYCYAAPTDAALGQSRMFASIHSFSTGSATPAYLFGGTFTLTSGSSIYLVKGTDLAPTHIGIFLIQCASTAVRGGLFCATILASGGNVTDLATSGAYTFGGLSEPGGSSDIALWVDASGNGMYIKNRLGGTETFALIELAQKVF